MESFEQERIKLRANYFLEQSQKQEAPLSREVLKGDALDLLNMLNYINQLERQVVLLSTKKIAS